MLCGKGRVRTQDLGYQAERYVHCATRQVVYRIIHSIQTNTRSIKWVVEGNLGF
jgi:hypothetical protein